MDSWILFVFDKTFLLSNLSIGTMLLYVKEKDYTIFKIRIHLNPFYG
jgi:hypothetical protein